MLPHVLIRPYLVSYPPNALHGVALEFGGDCACHGLVERDQRRLDAVPDGGFVIMMSTQIKSLRSLTPNPRCPSNGGKVKTAESPA